MARKELVDVSMQLHAETNAAILVSDDGNKDNAVWLPKSQIEFDRKGNVVEVTMPEWLALEKGLI